jgi:ubiquinol-cytochrome c reductase iron-sulfur subunit
MKLNGTHLIPDKANFWYTPSRPSNFGDHIDFKVTLDNWFDENRAYNEHDTGLRRTQIYTLSAIYYAGLLNIARLYAIGIIGRLNGWTRYDRNTYM